MSGYYYRQAFTVITIVIAAKAFSETVNQSTELYQNICHASNWEFKMHYIHETF